LHQLKTRLIRGRSHLDRQKGGIGLRGAGETQLELDQRMIGQRIKSINKSLAKVQGQREQGRRARRRAEIVTVSLVGYTNAGKSTLFNSLTSAKTYAADQLFATLDSTLRRVTLPNYGPVIVADTVGFISHLPHGLVEAFRATLEETAAANLLLHIVDAANDTHQELIGHVNTVLGEIGAQSVTQLEVFNKIDLIPGSEPRIQRDAQNLPKRVWVSAKTGAGMDLLQQAVSELLAGALFTGTIELAPHQAKLRSQLYEKEFVEGEKVNEDGSYHLHVKLPRTELDRVRQQGAIILAESATESATESADSPGITTDLTIDDFEDESREITNDAPQQESDSASRIETAPEKLREEPDGKASAG
jgi:GTP-binding protein HflX